MKCGLLGRKLGHSYSPQIHSSLGEYSYSLYENEPEELERFLNSGDFHGLNVTIPYKKAVIAYCAELSPVAEKLGAVNTIVRREDGSLIGHNTDYYGFRQMLAQSGLSPAGKKVLILGSGGASVTAVAVMQELGASVIVISRSGENNYTNLSLHYDAAIIVNTTPVGMYPNTDDSPIDIAPFTQLEGVLDVIYNPARTSLLMQAEQRGIVAINGLWMLVAQAKESAEWFTGHKIDDTVIGHIFKKLQKQMQNIVLIGMPGCGKSTVGKLLAQQLGRPFVDADIEIEISAYKPIPQIFEESGEAGFREMETSVLKRLGMQSGNVIATGGGCVTRQENYASLHCNGTIVWLQRSLDVLPTDGRPLSQTTKLADMYQIRKPLYDSFADFRLGNDCSAEETVNAILSALDMED